MKLELSDPRYKTWVILNQVLRLISKGRSRETRSSGLTATQWAVIMAIKISSEPTTSAEIGRILMRKPQAMTGLIRRMEDLGLVRKEVDGGKGGMIPIYVTEKGEEAYEQASHSEIIADAFSSLDEDELAQLLDLLKRVRDQATKSVVNTYAMDVAHLI